MVTAARSRWFAASLGFGVLRWVAVALVLGTLWFERTAPLGGRSALLWAGALVAAAVWLAEPLLERVHRGVATLLLAIGSVGGALAAVIAPGTAAITLPAMMGLLAGAVLSLPEAGFVTVCGMATLGVGAFVGAAAVPLLGSCLIVVGGLSAGLWRRQYVLRAAHAELAAAETRRAEAEHVRAQVLEERTRVSREVHDILAHTLGGLIIQLDAAEALLGAGNDREGASVLVRGARGMAVDGLAQTRRAVAALRAAPAQLSEALGTLASEMHLGTEYQVLGTPRDLSAEARIAMYRTAQEALTNVRKHAPEAPVSMTLTFDTRETVLCVRNGGSPAERSPTARTDGSLSTTGGGYGLRGLAERAELLGASLHAGPEGAGWSVELRVVDDGR